MVRGSAGLLPVASAWIDSVPANSSRTVVIPVPTAELSGRVELQVEVTRPGASVEILASNNLVLYAFTVAPLPSSAIQIFSDGVQLMDGDYVASSPQLLVRIAGAPSPGRWTELFVDGVPSVDRHVPVSARQEGGVHDDPVFSPQLTGGRHELRILVLDQNLVGAQDSVARRLTVQVSSEIRILQVFNYPNPFYRETEFTFVVAGPRAPEEVLIRIFTLSGRKIRELSLHPGVAQIGFNRVVWDGRDNDGDDIANGTYLYQVQVKGGGKTETAVQKLVKLR